VGVIKTNRGKMSRTEGHRGMIVNSGKKKAGCEGKLFNNGGRRYGRAGGFDYIMCITGTLVMKKCKER
jgi:hypothetical protein